jgi:hypothetical protein
VVQDSANMTTPLNLPRVAAIEDELRPLVEAITAHPLNGMVDTLPRVRVFMEHHVGAVWDFMSLLKALQLRLTCHVLPWRPLGDAAIRRYINELVLAEESDLVDGRAISHLELYVEAMRQAGADVGPARKLTTRQTVPLPPPARRFVRYTMSTTEMPLAHLAASFAFGRECLIPPVFRALRATAERHPRPLTLLLTYLDRHIEVDAVVHAPLARRLVAHVCADSEPRWAAALESGRDALQARVDLWDAIAEAMP